MATRRLIVDYDGDSDGIQNLRDERTGRYVELDALVDKTIFAVERGEDDQLIFVLDGDWDDEDEVDGDVDPDSE